MTSMLIFTGYKYNVSNTLALQTMKVTMLVENSKAMRVLFSPKFCSQQDTEVFLRLLVHLSLHISILIQLTFPGFFV